MRSLPYRSRAVSDPRGVLNEFGVELDDDVELRVLDSTADIRYLVSPHRPTRVATHERGQLRFAYRIDAGWWLEMVEFQPSQGRRGSYLNAICQPEPRASITPEAECVLGSLGDYPVVIEVRHALTLIARA